MNALFGVTSDDPSDPDSQGISWAEGGAYVQFIRTNRCPEPGQYMADSG
jgi:hypothetical protein